MATGDREFVAKIAELTRKSSFVKPCDLCTGGKASESCIQCKINVCEWCVSKHQPAEELSSHRLFPISVHMFCIKHDRHVLWSSKSCHQLCCPLCLGDDDCRHDLEEIYAKGQIVRHRLGTMGDVLAKATSDHRVYAFIRKILTEAKEQQAKFDEFFNSTSSPLNNPTTKVKEIKRIVGDKLDDIIEILEGMSKNMDEFTEAKNLLKLVLVYFIQQASDPEVVNREKEIPTYDTDTYKPAITTPVIELPDVTKLLDDIRRLLDNPDTDIEVRYRRYRLVSNIVKVDSYNVGINTFGMAIDSNKSTLIVRRNNATAPITVYDFRGQSPHVLGSDVISLYNSNNSNIAIDTSRGLYLLPSSTGEMVTVGMDGAVQSTITVIDHAIHGVSYSQQEDVYVISSASSSHNTVYVIDPITGQKISTFNPSERFIGPWQVLSSQFEGQAAIFVSDYGNNCIKILDMKGELVYTYGVGTLSRPYGLCTGPNGRTLVCDQGNDIVRAYWMEGTVERSEVILDRADLEGKQPRYVVYDVISEKLFVGNDYGDVIVYQA